MSKARDLSQQVDPVFAPKFLGFGGRNRIINGAMVINQRANSLAYTTGVTGYSGPDRFIASNVGAGGSFTQSQVSITGDNGGNLYALQQIVNTVPTSLASGNYWSGMVQTIEGFNCYDLKGRPVVVSFLFKTNWSGTLSVAIRDSTAAFSYVTTITVVANVLQRYVIPLPALPTAFNALANNAAGMTVWVGAQNTGTFAAAAGTTWQTGNYLCATGATAWSNTVGNYIQMTELQVEEGVTATEFERRTYNEEFLCCQRYYQTKSCNWTMYQAAGNTYTVALPFPVQMRVSPTLGYNSPRSINTSSMSITANSEVYGMSGYATATGVCQAAWNSVTFNAEF